ncbi:UNVERIFIED_CONTAM: hypothetical protein Sangu_0053800 [Sesamum angustifolium]|uniref:Uncharacterized protein n=1 Tax=Sesamum angustifolium TaxID=2727405 RepID=A0AAW2RHZ7_9LAMI
MQIVRKSSAQLEAASAVTWPRIARASPFPVPRFGRSPFARGVPSSYRARMPIKPGARSFQWKREAQPTEALGQASSSIVPPPPNRSLTYVRPEPKTEAKTNESSSTFFSGVQGNFEQRGGSLHHDKLHTHIIQFYFVWMGASAKLGKHK